MAKIMIAGSVTAAVSAAAIAVVFRYSVSVGAGDGLVAPVVFDRWTGQITSCVPAHNKGELDIGAQHLQTPHRWNCTPPR